MKMYQLPGNWESTAQGMGEAKVDSKWMVPLSMVSKHDSRLILSVLTARRVVGEEGERIGQLVLNKVEQIEWNPVLALADTTRGSGGFGSTGK